jgi:hypothetical protein
MTYARLAEVCCVPTALPTLESSTQRSSLMLLRRFFFIGALAITGLIACGEASGGDNGCGTYNAFQPLMFMRWRPEYHAFQYPGHSCVWVTLHEYHSWVCCYSPYPCACSGNPDCPPFYWTGPESLWVYPGVRWCWSIDPMCPREPTILPDIMQDWCLPYIGMKCRNPNTCPHWERRCNYRKSYYFASCCSDTTYNGCKDNDTLWFPQRSPYWNYFGRAFWKPVPGNPTWSDTSRNPDNWYRPNYGDTLRYVITTTRPLWVEVWLNSSTYQGMAMNVDVPPGYNPISDIVQVRFDAHNPPWDTLSFDYVGDRTCLKLINRIPPYTTVGIAFRVLDYAAEAKISLHPQGMKCAVFDSSIYVPKNLKYFIGTTDSIASMDPDSDGLTRWEEYRGFCRVKCEIVCKLGSVCW